MGNQPLSQAMESCQSLPYPGKLPRIYSSQQADFLLTLFPTFYLGIQQKEQEAESRPCQTPTAENSDVPNCKDGKAISITSWLWPQHFAFSDQFYWSHFPNDQLDLVNLDALKDIMNYQEFNYDPSKALVLDSSNEAGLRIRASDEPTIAICELDLGKKLDFKSNKS